MSTCLCDAFFDDVAKATVEVLEYLGCTVDFPESQTCCGQPAFNGGDWKSARTVVRHQMKAFEGDAPVIVPSGSCAAMAFHGSLLAFEKEQDLPEVEALAKRTWEVCDFIVNGLGVKQIKGNYAARIAIHNSCHTRGTGTGDAAATLLGSIEGVELVTYGEPEQCCGFGGTFAVAFPHISGAMGRVKIENLLELKPDMVVSADMSCLMHQRGLANKANIPYTAQHVIQVIRDALRNGGELA
ncbi:MAG: (Fe-S)-binding protein [Verrucomicrobiota bacterium JB022]|nr:(Fe-S)-binding protein [Verrucomicrobiota bacterium JB022]